MNAKNIFGAFTLAIALFFVWLVIGSWQEVGALRSALAERQVIAEQRSAILTKAATAYTSYQTLLTSAVGRNFTAMVPVKKNTAELVSAIQDIANNADVRIAQIQIAEDKEKTGGQYRTLTLSVEMSGSYAGLRTFLVDLEQYVRILNVSEIQVSMDQQTCQLKYMVKAAAYFLK